MSTDTTTHDDAQVVDPGVQEPGRKPLRADAQRNYDKIIETARQMFREKNADVSMDAIAKRAGVGPGTLYRHFPNREALVDAVMLDWAKRVQASADQVIAAGGTSRKVLVAWLDEFFDHVSRYQGAAAKFGAAMDDPSSPMYRKCVALGQANRSVLSSVEEQGDLREGVDPREVMRMVTGIASVADQSGLTHDGARGMLAIVADGVLRA
jgi:AcrR family transcriptional regulator